MSEFNPPFPRTTHFKNHSRHFFKNLIIFPFYCTLIVLSTNCVSSLNNQSLHGQLPHHDLSLFHGGYPSWAQERCQELLAD